jgi:shikimate dehydrogenase
MKISGVTRVYAHIGHPIGHVRAPGLFNQLVSDRDIDAVMIPVEVTPSELPSLVPGFRAWRNLAGVGVTIPHKETMTQLVDELTPMARLCGATNVIRREEDGTLLGGQVDGIGLADSLVAAGHCLDGARVLLSGGGGTARAVAFALADRGVARLEVANRTRDKAEAIVAGVRSAYPGCDAVIHGSEGEFDFVVNTTSLGMHPNDPLPVDDQVLRPGVVVADAVMAPPETELLKLAAERDCIPHPGMLMLQAQLDWTLDFLGLVEQ